MYGLIGKMRAARGQRDSVMQYLRVIFVSMTAAIVAKMWVDTSGIEVPPIIWFPPIDAQAFAATSGIALVGGLAGKLCRLPSPFFLGTFIFGTVVHLGLGVEMQLPPWLLAISYAMALQSARFLVVLLVGPSVARLVARSIRD